MGRGYSGSTHATATLTPPQIWHCHVYRLSVDNGKTWRMPFFSMSRARLGWLGFWPAQTELGGKLTVAHSQTLFLSRVLFSAQPFSPIRQTANHSITRGHITPPIVYIFLHFHWSSSHLTGLVFPTRWKEKKTKLSAPGRRLTQTCEGSFALTFGSRGF